MKYHIKQRVPFLAVFLALSIILSYVEFLIPINFQMPGIKLGLANIVTVVILYNLNVRDAFIINILRVLISGFLFSGILTIIYGLIAGGISLIVMYLFYRSDRFSIFGVSVIGAVTHNLCQLLVAIFIIRDIRLSFYGPFLMVAGAVFGIIIGFLSDILTKRLKHMFVYDNI